jgi:hypothetical protein
LGNILRIIGVQLNKMNLTLCDLNKVRCSTFNIIDHHPSLKRCDEVSIKLFEAYESGCNLSEEMLNQMSLIIRKEAFYYAFSFLFISLLSPVFGVKFPLCVNSINSEWVPRIKVLYDKT